MSIFTLTPYDYWRKNHAVHHANSGNLDRRGVGDVETLTVKEYLARGAWARFAYRLYRNPLVLFGIGAYYYFIIEHRIPVGKPLPCRQIWLSVLSTDFAILGVTAIVAAIIGLEPMLLVHVPIVLIASSIGSWLFYVQHQFENAYWKHADDWNFQEAALKGSSYYALPKVLQWFTGNIGLHHIHHLSSKIPNYRLQECFDDNPELRFVTRLTLAQSLKCARLTLWDEEHGKMIGFRHIIG